jgi:hypothetical protein
MKRCSTYPPWTNTTRGFDLDSCENRAVLPASAFLLLHLAFAAELLEDHLGVAADVGVGVVKAHFGVLRTRRDWYCRWMTTCEC